MDSQNPHAEGLYQVKAQSWGFVETINGHEQFWMRFALVGAVDKENIEGASKPCAPGTGTWSITINSDENAAWLISIVQHLGYTGNDLVGLDPSTPNAFDFEGKEFIVACKHEEFKDQVRAKWTVFRPSAVKPLTKDRLLAINERYGHLVPQIKERHAAKVAEAVARAAEKAARIDSTTNGPSANGTSTDSAVTPNVGRCYAYFPAIFPAYFTAPLNQGTPTLKGMGFPSSRKKWGTISWASVAGAGRFSGT